MSETKREVEREIREGEEICSSQERVTQEQLRQSGRIGDNEVKFSEDESSAILYEAPGMEQFELTNSRTAARGWYSEWTQSETGEFERVGFLSGDDSMVYTRFQKNRSSDHLF